MRKRLGLVVSIGLLAGLFVSPAAAREVNFIGFTNGCFGAACVPPSTSAQQGEMLLGGLTYINSTFGGATTGGLAALNNPRTSPNFNNLGSFILFNPTVTYTGQSFTLRVTFTTPPSITGGNSRTFSALLTGSVANEFGSVFIDFDNTPTTFAYSYVDDQGTTVFGSFQFSVNDLTVFTSAMGQVALTGQIFNAQEQTSTAVQLRSLAAARSANGVVVHWRTASEVDTLGFHVYRQANGKRVRVNRTLIAAKGRGGYSFLDRKAPRGKTVRYWLQVVDLDGSRTWYGPARVSAR